ncbi:MAG: DNA-3-methyladenine glycosylase 2 family protein [Candidatus Kerfeldbacteria bacterium]|nr:DNA-3-methyladenine glycosylase 2 family protein [Candidatus Kerfeldbacteria bacterium]
MKKNSRTVDLEASLAHLRKDERLRRLIQKHTKPELRKTRNAFQSLAESIIYQQLSSKAAGTIYKRFVALYDADGTQKKFPLPVEVLNSPVDLLRTAGVSNQKASYLIDLARRFEDGTITPRLFASMTDEEISKHLIQVKGIGQWTVDMFLIFALNRPDILPVGDLAIQKAFQRLFKLRQLPSAKRMQQLAAGWRGHRTVACLYLWKSVDN